MAENKIVDDSALAATKTEEVAEAVAEEAVEEGSVPESGVKEGSEIPIISNVDVQNILDSASRGFFGKMSERGKKIAGGIYEGVHKFPLANRVVAKMEIAYNQFWINRQDKKAVKAGNKADAFDLQLKVLSRSKEAIISHIESMKRMGIPTGSLQLELKKIEKQEAKLLGKKDKSQSKLEKRLNKAGKFVNRRDNIADKLIEYFDDKLRPIERRLESVQDQRNEVELLVLVAEARHHSQEAAMRKLEEERKQIEAVIRDTKRPGREIKNALKLIDARLKQGREAIRKDKEDLNKRMDRINKKVAKIDNKVNKKKDKQDRFVRIKQRRPLELDVQPRKRAENFSSREEAQIYSEREYEESGYEEKAEEAMEVRVSEFISGWNEYLRHRFRDSQSKIVEEADFLGLSGLSGDEVLNVRKLGKVLEGYYKIKGIAIPDIKETLEKLFPNL